MFNTFDTPWKLWNYFFCKLTHPYIRLLFYFNQIPWGLDWHFYGVPIIQKHRRSQMRFGSGLQLRSTVRSNPLGPNHPVILCTWQEGALIKAGDNFAMSGGVLCAADSITIGNHVAVGTNTTIIDTDFHPIEHTLRQKDASRGASAPIRIADHVFVGMSCLILKGVTVGESSVIGAGSVVTKDIPAGVVVAGNPAKIIRELI
jgi:acetyltransferase-like isoleucine patch superfamily enzyme